MQRKTWMWVPMLPTILRYSILAITLWAAMLAAARPAAAGWYQQPWPNSPGANLQLASMGVPKNPPVIAPDGAGGAFIAWPVHMGASGYDLRYHHVLGVGPHIPGWPDGAGLCSATGDQISPGMASDGAGGVFVVWQDARSGFGTDNIYVQHILANQLVDPAWPVDGLAICTATGQQTDPVITSYGNIAFVAWTDNRVFASDIYLQAVTSTGTLLYAPNGIAMCAAGGAQTYPAIATDEQGAAIVAWNDFRGPASDIYAQRVDFGGTTWAANGVPVSTAAGPQVGPSIVSDGSGGAVITWSDARIAVGQEDIYAQRVRSNGLVDPLWPVNGRAVCNAANVQIGSLAVTDGAGGAIVAWNDVRGGTNDVYAHRILVSGEVDVTWPSNGRSLCVAAGNQILGSIVPDGAGGAIVAWSDGRSVPGQEDIYAQHVMVTSAIGWPSEGRLVSNGPGAQTWARMAGDGSGNAILAWLDTRNGAYGDIYAQRVERFGRLGNPEPRIETLRDVANDQGGRVVIEWMASYLDAFPNFEVNQYSVWRRIGSVGLAARRVVTSSAVAARERGTVLRLSSAESEAQYWEHVEDLPARGLPGYSYVAPTASDSVDGSNPLTAFMVLAETGTDYWPSTSVSGYSVDNLAPATPQSFTGTYNAGAIRLHWARNSEADLAHYRIYRGSSTGFVPGPGNRIATPPDTGYADFSPSGGYYKISAVDIHGNESGFALLTPQGTASVLPVGLIEPMLALPSPNPARSASTMRFALPRESHVALAIYDAGGRRVRGLIDGDRAAGEHTLTWDLRDDRGESVRSGLYFLRLEAGGRRIVQRVVAAR